MDTATRLEGGGAVAVKLKFIEPLCSLGQPGFKLQEHRVDEACANGRHLVEISLELSVCARVALPRNLRN